MIFRQVLDEDLGCASYVIADGGEAVVVDPRWEIGAYLDLARRNQLRIAHVIETHNHADHVSGKSRLVAATGATVHVSDRAGVSFPHAPLADGDTVQVGRALITALATPGHRPEHLALAVADLSRSEEPLLLLTGDSLFVGDVARPDLALERAEGARQLFRTLQRLDAFPDWVEVWPGHVGGSLCGGAGMSRVPVSTLGYERRFNPLLSIADERFFVDRLVAALPPRPANYERIVELNRGPLLEPPGRLRRLRATAVERILAEGGSLVDGRPSAEFGAAHVPGSVSVGLDRPAVGTRAVWAADPEAPVVVTAQRESDAVDLAGRLQAVGFRGVSGFLSHGLEGWRSAGLPTASIETIEVERLAAALREGGLTVVDVREEHEWRAGHVRGSLHVPCRELRARAAELREVPGELVVACATGNRTALAASVLRREGVERVRRVAGAGIPALLEQGVLPEAA